ncbi:MAG: IclR family transcriptional regulator [Marivita sp.]
METDTEDKNLTNALVRGVKVLGAFRASDQGVSHTEICKRTGLSKATVSRLIHTLKMTGFVIQDTRSGLFQLGPASVALGLVANAQTSFMDLIDDDMQELADRTGTLALIGVRNRDRMMLVRTWRPTGAASIWLEPGHRVPFLGSSTGQAFVAALSDAAFEALDPDDELRAFRDDGYAQLVANGFTSPPTDMRFAETINAVAVPYMAHEYGEPIAFSCGALPDMLSDERINTEVGPGLRELVRGLEVKTGQASALARRG